MLRYPKGRRHHGPCHGACNTFLRSSDVRNDARRLELTLVIGMVDTSIRAQAICTRHGWTVVEACAGVNCVDKAQVKSADSV